ncbi:cytochrome c family protein [Meridianimarinicoccus sp. MJW13]|uniref:c-type cytochrome n=1 Tax=Meridianimarinicoccus sp. MJW13 TaxID=2720031 RepID=UPI001866965D|nr:cytochrome c family protein [Fluviibacterium sp. MJW13]
MLDTMTMTKIVGAFCGALLVYLLGGWVGESLYTTGGGHGDHGEQAYLIDTGEEDGHGDSDTAEIQDFASVLTEADADKGEKVFGKCKACHKLDGTDGTGPHLDGVVDRGIASIAGFAYSDALADRSAEAWTAENLDGFLENPKNWAPGTKMSFAGLKKITDRANLVAYLQTTGN